MIPAWTMFRIRSIQGTCSEGTKPFNPPLIKSHKQQPDRMPFLGIGPVFSYEIENELEGKRMPEMHFDASIVALGSLNPISVTSTRSKGLLSFSLS